MQEVAAGSNCPEELVVYECHGEQPPRGEPRLDGFLGLWPEAPFYYLFFDRPASMVTRWVAEQPGWSLLQVYRMPYAQWQDTAQRDFHVGPFLIRTGLGHVAPVEGQIPIHLRAGVAFGSGVHPTTKGCLETIAQLYESIPPGRVVDLGTGTGILSIACAKLGATNVWGVDCNPLAIKEAAANVRMNGADGIVRLLIARSLDVIRGGGDLLLMNIEWLCLKQVLQHENWVLFDRSIMSGFLDTQWNHFTSMLPSSCRVASRLVIDGWVTVAVESSGV